MEPNSSRMQSIAVTGRLWISRNGSRHREVERLEHCGGVKSRDSSVAGV